MYVCMCVCACVCVKMMNIIAKRDGPPQLLLSFLSFYI